MNTLSPGPISKHPKTSNLQYSGLRLGESIFTTKFLRLMAGLKINGGSDRQEPDVLVRCFRPNLLGEWFSHLTRWFMVYGFINGN